MKLSMGWRYSGIDSCWNYSIGRPPLSMDSDTWEAIQQGPCMRMDADTIQRITASALLTFAFTDFRDLNGIRRYKIDRMIFSLNLPSSCCPNLYQTPSSPNPLPIFLASTLFRNPSRLNSLVFRAHVSPWIRPRTSASYRARSVTSIPRSSQTTSYSCFPTTEGAVRVSSTLGI